jgi:serine/threonine protein kinase
MQVPQTIGRYEILGSIGSGGMGTLLRARDPRIGGRTVAIKLLKEGIRNDEIRHRFMQEANAAGVLEHENIVRIFDVGEQDGEPFIAMEYIDGETLSMWIRRKEPATVSRRLRLLEELCDGLAYAHSFDIVHRDIKPANLMVERRRGHLKILDFGIAKLASSDPTSAGALLGSFNYTSPEHVLGLAIDHRSDIFSVGAVMFELLSYQQAFPGGLGDGVLERIAEQASPQLRQVIADADPKLEQIIDKALEKDPVRRYSDLTAMHSDITRVRRRLEREESSGRMEAGAHHRPVDAAVATRAHEIQPEHEGVQPLRAEVAATRTRDGSRAGPSSSRQARQAVLDAMLADATARFEKGDYAGAIVRCDAALRIDPAGKQALRLRRDAVAARRAGAG